MIYPTDQLIYVVDFNILAICLQGLIGENGLNLRGIRGG